MVDHGLLVAALMVVAAVAMAAREKEEEREVIEEAKKEVARGVKKASAAALKAWRLDQHRRPPLNYESQFFLTKAGTQRTRYRSCRC